RQAMYKTVQSAKAGKDEDELIEKRREEAEVKAREEAFRERATAAGKIAGVANKAQSGPEELAKRFAQNANDSEIGEYLNSKDANLVDAALESKTLTYPKPARDHLDRLLDLASDDDPNNIKRAHRAIDLITLHLKKGTFDAQEDEEIRRRIGDKLKFGERFGDKYAGKK
ncbi:MAG: hypothetical protein KGH67_03945, partial [Candidatus Micrarchaeota archaeon]|nr:hypothetical protein [Candidatus Micrarchaeota archaeon]